MLDEDYGDITDPKTGRDVKVTCSKANGKTYSSTDVMPRGKASLLSESPDKSKQWLSNIPNLDELFTEKSYEELEKIVNDWLNGDTTSASSELGTSRGEPPAVAAAVSTLSSEDDAPKASSKAGGSKYKSLEDAFADLEDA